jgi:phage gp36-like protein
MAFLIPNEISSHLYGEVTTEINRGDATLLQAAIDAAQEEASGYLTAYDQAAIFAAVGDARNPILLLYVKDISVWHYIQLSNPAVEMELRMERYKSAIKWLEKVQSGKTNPNLPYRAVVDPDVPANYLKTGSNLKRNNNF